MNWLSQATQSALARSATPTAFHSWPRSKPRVAISSGPEKRRTSRPRLEQLLKERIADSDIVITSGGVSMGDLDLVKALLVELATVHFRRIFFKPGKPLNFATSGDTLIFGLPGNPVRH